jgi:hypothetical protein
MKAGLSPSEQCYMDEYSKLVTEYGRACGVRLYEVPLCVCASWVIFAGAQNEKPVKSHRSDVLVEVLKDAGIVQTSRGSILLKTGTRVTLPRHDVQVLIRSGHVRIVELMG